MSDIYKEFGVNSAVMSSSDISEHEQNMLALNVDARDGDDALTLEEPEEGTEEQEEESQDESGEQEEQGDEQEEGKEDAPEGDIENLPEVPDALREVSDQLSTYADGFDALKGQAFKLGLAEASALRMETEYESTGKLSDASYAELEKVGYSRQFIDSYIKGQESISEQYVAKVVEYAGGQEKFQRIVAHMKATSPESVDSLNEAIERQDLKAVRTIINLGIQGLTKKFGKAPSRNITKSAPAAQPKRSAPTVEGYGSRSEMVADMSKAEYRNDPAFRAKVEARVAATSF